MGRVKDGMGVSGGMGEAIIRKAVSTDASAIASVHVASWRTTYKGMVPDTVLENLSHERRANWWTHVLTQPTGDECVFVAEASESGIVGFASGGHERTGEYPSNDGELYAIYLLASHHRQGVGSRLFHAVAETLVEQGFHAMMCWVLEENPSRRFYEAKGGIRIGQKTVEMGGVELQEIAYGWDRIEQFCSRTSEWI
jgi:GNAT superfamily N-acetyltransferase